MYQKHSFGVVTSLNIGRNTDSEDPIKKRQRENREKLKKHLDNREVPGYNVTSEVDELVQTLFSGDGTMAGRKAKVATNVFLAAFMAAYKAGKTNAEFAKEFGMDAKAASIKASGIRSNLAKKGKVLPHLKAEAGGNTELDALIASLDDVPTATDTDSDTLDAVDGDAGE